MCVPRPEQFSQSNYGRYHAHLSVPVFFEGSELNFKNSISIDFFQLRPAHNINFLRKRELYKATTTVCPSQVLNEYSEGTWFFIIVRPYLV